MSGNYIQIGNMRYPMIDPMRSLFSREPAVESRTGRTDIPHESKFALIADLDRVDHTLGVHIEIMQDKIEKLESKVEDLENSIEELEAKMEELWDKRPQQASD
jgi:hypothetical protein